MFLSTAETSQSIVLKKWKKKKQNEKTRRPNLLGEKISTKLGQKSIRKTILVASGNHNLGII